MISIIIPVRNVGEMIGRMTSHCLKTIRGNTVFYHEVILSEFNESIAKTYNEGVKKAKGEYICCLHNDCEVTQEWEGPLVEEAMKGNISFPIVDDSQYSPEWRGIAPVEEWMPPGCCFMMTRETWDRIGGNDENFIPYHWEDTDLFYRAKKLGIKLIRTTSKVVHWRGVTRGLMENRDKELLTLGRNYFFEKHRNGNGKPSITALHYPTLDNANDKQVRYFI